MMYKKKALVLRTARIEVQELYERLTDPGPGSRSRRRYSNGVRESGEHSERVFYNQS